MDVEAVTDAQAVVDVGTVTDARTATDAQAATNTHGVMDVEALLRELDDHGPWARTATGYWASWPDLDVRAMARLMLRHQVRLVTITGTQEDREEDGDTLRVIYHWDVGGALLNLSTMTKSGHLPTISDILPGADWAEREIRDYYGSEFDGRSTTPPLMLREGDPPGLFTRTREQGTDDDPARTARAAVAAEDAAEEADHQEGEHR